MTTDQLPGREELRAAGWVRADDLMGLSDIGKLFGVPVQTVSSWRTRAEFNGMPAPVAEPSGGPVFDGVEVLRWYAAWVPPKGRKGGSLPPEDVVRSILGA